MDRLPEFIRARLLWCNLLLTTVLVTVIRPELVATLPPFRRVSWTGWIIAPGEKNAGQPVWKGSRDGLFTYVDGVKEYINCWSRTQPGAISPSTRRRLVRATIAPPLNEKLRIRLSIYEKLLVAGRTTVPAAVVQNLPVGATAFSGFLVHDGAARVMNGLPIWEGPRDGLFVITPGSTRPTYINRLEPGTQPGDLSFNMRRSMIRAVVV